MGDRRQRSDDDDEFETRRSSRRLDRERTKGSKRRDRSSRRSDESEYSDSEEDRRKGKRAKRDIKEEEIMDYMVKKAQKKALKVAKKLKTNEAGYSNDSNPFGDSNLAEKLRLKRSRKEGKKGQLKRQCWQERELALSF